MEEFAPNLDAITETVAMYTGDGVSLAVHHSDTGEMFLTESGEKRCLAGPISLGCTREEARLALEGIEAGMWLAIRLGRADNK